MSVSNNKKEYIFWRDLNPGTGHFREYRGIIVIIIIIIIIIIIDVIQKYTK